MLQTCGRYYGLRMLLPTPLFTAMQPAGSHHLRIDHSQQHSANLVVLRLPIPHGQPPSSPIYSNAFFTPKPSVAPRSARGAPGITSVVRVAPRQSLNQTPAPSWYRGGMGRGVPHANLSRPRTSSLSHRPVPLPLAVSLKRLSPSPLRASSFFWSLSLAGRAREG